MKWLNFRNDAELAQSLEVIGRDHLRVDQTKAPVANAVLPVQLFEIVEQDVVCFVTDRVNRHLQTRAVGVEHVLKELAFDKVALLIDHQRPPLAAIGRIVRVAAARSARCSCP